MINSIDFKVLAASLGLLAGLGHAAANASGDYPSRPIQFQVGYAVGGSADTIARIVMPDVGKRLGQTIVMDNRSGAGGVIGLTNVAKAAPDGYTMGIGTGGALTANVHLSEKLPYNAERDLAPVSMLVRFPIALAVNPDSGIDSVEELIERAKSASVSYGSAGNGSSTHLAGELLNQLAGVKMEHVPYRGTGPAQVDLVAGHLQAVFTDLPTVAPLAASGRLRILAVASSERSSLAPEIPTIAESGIPGYAFHTWMGIVMPAGTPEPIIAKVNKELRAVLTDPAMRQRMINAGGEPAPSSPEEFREIIRADTESAGKIIRSANIKLN